LSANDDIAAVILEPIQSMAGVRTAPAGYFQDLAKICSEHGVVLIFDEIQTGCGRTGKFVYAQQVGVTPDIITLAKSLGSGVPVGATLVSDELASTIKLGDHGSTFGGGMIAMAAVTATLETIADYDLAARAVSIADHIADSLKPLVSDVRGAGCLLGVELPYPAKEFISSLRTNGLLVGGSDDPNTIRLMPPLNCPEDVLDQALDIITAALSSVKAAA